MMEKNDKKVKDTLLSRRQLHLSLHPLVILLSIIIYMHQTSSFLGKEVGHGSPGLD